MLQQTSDYLLQTKLRSYKEKKKVRSPGRTKRVCNLRLTSILSKLEKSIEKKVRRLDEAQGNAATDQ